MWSQNISQMKKPESGKLNYSDPKDKEAGKVAEIRSLSYLERLERLMAILEISFLIKGSTKMKKDDPANS